MSIAFDFSVEEIWVTLMAGATIVPGLAGMTLIGDELGDFLRERRVTVMACCPTLLATIEQDVPDLRILIVGGEVFPQNLVARWYRPGRHILNTYGPTETTVTATMTELRPDKPVTIGVPLPTYSIVILDPHEDKTVPTGELGEIGIAGVGLALGYMNRDDLTMNKFIRDFLHIENNPSGRIYRTGDLGRLDENGEIHYHGRIDTQVKIRGYRIELKEIEAVLLDLPQVAQAAVTTFEPEEGVVEIVAYYALKKGLELPRSEISQTLRSKLPVYMVPAFLEQVDAIPLTVSNKADYKRLPKPQQLQRFSPSQGYVPPKTDRECMLHAALAGVLRAEHISTEHHFFDDLGANSLLMARVCAAIRRNPGMSNVSMRDIYMHPTIARLAHHLDSSIDGICRRNQAGTLPRSVEPVVRHVRRPADWVLRGLFAVRPLDLRGRLSMGDRRLRQRGGALRAQRRLRRRIVCCADRGSRRGEMAADRPLQGAIDSDLELCIFPLLGRQDPDAHIACGCLHRHTDL